MNPTSVLSPRAKKVELFARPGCGLCDEALAVLQDVRQRIPFDLVETDIRHSLTLWETYRYEVPVVCVDGEPHFRHRVKVSSLEAILLREGE
jgi:hypothetical protein